MTSNRFPNLFIVGAPKCGTTSLAFYLGQHPDVFLPPVKEPLYFGSDITIDADRIPKERYIELYKNWNLEEYAIDATPAYLISRNAASEIHGKNPNAKIIICVRNPVEAVVSAYYHNKYRLTEEAPTLEDALALETQRESLGKPPKFGSLQALLYTSLFSYSQTIPRFISEFGSENVQIVILDDLSNDPEGELVKIASWLGIDDPRTHQIRYRVKNPSSTYRSKILTRIALHPPSWVGRISRPLLPKHFRMNLRRFVEEFNRVPRKPPSLNPNTRAMLVRTFAHDVQWLSDYLRRDLSGWLSKK